MKKMVLTVVVLCATCVSAAARADDSPDVIEARKQFSAGVNLLDDPDGAKYEEAYRAFKKAYALSQNPKVLGNIAYCAMNLERDGEAIDAYAAYLRDVKDIDERERAQIQRDLATLTSTVATVRVRVRHSATAFELVDTRLQTRGPAVENSYAVQGNEITIRIRPGRHTFRARTGNTESTPVEVTIEPASSTTQELTFPAPRASAPVVVAESPSLAGPVILGVTGLVAVGAGVASGMLAKNELKTIESNCPNDLCPTTYDLDGARTKAKTYGTIADASFVGGGALLAGAVLWYVLLPKRRVTPNSFAASAMCTGGECGVSIRGGF